MNIRGIDGLTDQEIQQELENGGRFVLYTWTLSIVVMTFRRPSDIFFVRGGESRFAKGLPYTLSTLLFGWWGIPWGPIYSLMSIGGNLAGGKDVTAEIVNAAQGSAAKAKARAAFRAGREAAQRT